MRRSSSMSMVRHVRPVWNIYGRATDLLCIWRTPLDMEAWTPVLPNCPRPVLWARITHKLHRLALVRPFEWTASKLRGHCHLFELNMILPWRRFCRSSPKSKRSSTPTTDQLTRLLWAWRLETPWPRVRKHGSIGSAKTNRHKTPILLTGGWMCFIQLAKNMLTEPPWFFRSGVLISSPSSWRTRWMVR